MNDDLRAEIRRWLELYHDLGVSSIDREAAAAVTSRGTTARGQEPEKSVSRQAAAAVATIRLPSTDSLFDALPKAQETLQAIRADIGDCTRCKLCAGRRHIVFGSGSPKAALMFVGEGPGADEDLQGLPFVGKAGQLLTKIIESIQLERGQVYIANVIKCRPPGNRNPEPDEIATCSPFLFRQIEAVNPRVICALGKIGTQTILQTDAPISRLRGVPVQWRGRIVVPTFHPAYLLRNPAAKREVWEDMKLIRSLLQQIPG